MSAEEIGFALTALAARVIRRREGRMDEELGLITDLWSQWLVAHRNGRGYRKPGDTNGSM